MKNDDPVGKTNALTNWLDYAVFTLGPPVLLGGFLLLVGVPLSVSAGIVAGLLPICAWAAWRAGSPPSYYYNDGQIHDNRAGLDPDDPRGAAAIHAVRETFVPYAGKTLTFYDEHGAILMSGRYTSFRGLEGLRQIGRLISESNDDLDGFKQRSSPGVVQLLDL